MPSRDPVLEPLTYTVPQAARVLNISATFLREKIAAGEIQLVPGFGRRKLIGREYLAEWVRDQQVAS